MANVMKYLSPMRMAMGDRKDPMKAAQPFMDQIKQGYQPYAQAGQQAMDTTQPQYQRMAKDPQSMINEILAGYEQSPGAKYQQDRLGQGMANTAAAGGYRGTGYDQAQQGELMQGLMSQDMQQWLQNVTGMQGRGMQGLEQATGRGYNAMEGIGSVLGQEGGMAAEGANQSNARRAAMLKAIGQIGGTMLGGPAAGGAMGETMGGIFGGGFDPKKEAGKRQRYGQQLGGAAAGDLFGMF